VEGPGEKDPNVWRWSRHTKTESIVPVKSGLKLHSGGGEPTVGVEWKKYRILARGKFCGDVRRCGPKGEKKKQLKNNGVKGGVRKPDPTYLDILGTHGTRAAK